MIPEYQTFLLPVLLTYQDKKVHSNSDVNAYVKSYLNLSDEDIKEKTKKGKDTKFENRTSWSRTYLFKAKLIEKVSRGNYQITDRGLKFLADNPKEINIKDLTKYPEFRNFQKNSHSKVTQNKDYIQDNEFTWTSFYSDFADVLLSFKEKRTELIELIQKAFLNSKIKLPKLDSVYPITDIDPFTVFALFNRGLTDSNRLKILKEIKDLFSINSELPRDFNGVPTVNPINILFYRYSDERSENEIDNLWEFFEVALDYSKDPSEENSQKFIQLFDLIEEKKNISWKITLALFWIKPFDFLSLDKNNRELLSDEAFAGEELTKEIKVLERAISGQHYLSLIKKVKEEINNNNLKHCKNFIDFSYLAWKRKSSQIEKDVIEDEEILNEELTSSRNKELLTNEYNINDFLNEVFLDKSQYEVLVKLLKRKKNLILYGAPGTGKTFAAERLAYSLTGQIETKQIQFVQFHQSYSYEDFIIGFRPKVDSEGFELKEGSFYKFCKTAEADPENDYFFIIDEINRGNLNNILGELFTLLEADKRGKSLQLQYVNEYFIVPNNLYIIGMMNTADRSLAFLDYALRRRFAFFEFEPAFHSDGFKRYQLELNNEKFNKLIETIIQLNDTIRNDDSLGRGFQIGHSYFCNVKNEDNNPLEEIVFYELIPLLKEYWFDEPSKVKEWSSKLLEAIK